VKLLCKLYRVTPAGFYAWRSRGVCQRARDDEKLLAQIRSIFDSSGGYYGSPRIHVAIAASNTPATAFGTGYRALASCRA